MVLPFPIAASQTDPKSPVDDELMDAIREDLEDLDDRLLTNKSFDYEFKINGSLTNYPVGFRNRLDGALIARAQTFTRARLYLENPGTSGTLQVDIRKYKRPNTPITAISSQFSDTINNIAQVAPNLATQSVSLATASVATQSITRWKATVNVSSVILLGNNLVRYNLSGPIDADWHVGDSVTFASMTNPLNDGTFNAVRIGDDGGNNIVITNATGVAQTAAAGNVGLNAWSYNYVNPLAASFVVGESAIFATHANAGNNGTFELYAVNSGGNNLVVKNSLGIAQAGVAGTAQTTRWVYSFLAPASATDFVTGEFGRFAAHTSGANNGDFLIKAVNSGGNNIVVSNVAGVVQGGVAGTANTTRWIYSLPTSPVGSVIAGETMHVINTTNPLNSGYLVVKEVNRLGTNNLVFSNVSGVAQAGAAGSIQHTHMIFSFATDQSAVYSTASRAYFTGCIEPLYNASAGFDVLEVNRGGGANFNIVVMVTSFAATAAQALQASPAGRVKLESRSIFINKPTLTLATNLFNSTNRHMQYDTKSLPGDFTEEATVVAGDLIAVDLVSIPVGAPSDVVVQLV